MQEYPIQGQNFGLLQISSRTGSSTVGRWMCSIWKGWDNKIKGICQKYLQVQYKTINIMSIQQFYLLRYGLVSPLEMLFNMPNYQSCNWYIYKYCQLLFKWNIFWITVIQFLKFINQFSEYIVRNTQLIVNAIGIAILIINKWFMVIYDRTCISL
jgi:hypothetical protein